MEQFIKVNLTSEEAFWVMWYFLKEHYDLSEGKFDISDILSASEPVKFDANAHFDFDGKAENDSRIGPIDQGMVGFWNDAIEKFRKDGLPPLKSLT